MPLNRFVHEFLLKLERASGDGHQWVDEVEVGDIPANDRQIAVAAGWVKERGFGNLRAYKILPAGYTALGQNADALMRYLHADLNGGAPIDPEISVSLYGESLGADSPRHKGEGQGVRVCNEPGCDLPRYKTFHLCETHMKAYWSRKQREKRLPKNRTADRPTRRKAIHSAIRPPTADDDTQPDLPIVGTRRALSANSVSPLAHLLAATLVRGLVLLWKVKGR